MLLAILHSVVPLGGVDFCYLRMVSLTAEFNSQCQKLTFLLFSSDRTLLTSATSVSHPCPLMLSLTCPDRKVACLPKGYGFVNFSSTAALLQFASEKMGRRWNLFSSEKVLQLSFANVQSKAALVKKFRDSPVMLQQEEYRVSAASVFPCELGNLTLLCPFHCQPVILQ